MRLCRVFVLLLLLAGAPAAAVSLAETPMFRRHGVDDGLPSSTVYKLAEDRDGFIWAGTHDGLARYDGVAFRVWRNIPGDDTSIARNEVSALFVDQANRVWAGGEGSGLNVLDTARQRFRRYRHDDKNPASLSADDVWAISQDASGAIWVGMYAGGLDRLRADGTGFDHFRAADAAGLASDNVLSLLGTDDGSLWIGSDAGLARRHKDGKIEKVVLHDQPGAPQVMALAAEDGQVLATTSAGIYRISLQGTVQRVDPGVAPRMLYAALRDGSGDYWLGTRQGTVRRSRQGGEIVYRAQPLMPGGLPGEDVFDLLADREGGLWLATLDGGVAYLAPTWRRFSQWREEPGRSDSLSPGRIQGLTAGAEDAVWVVGLAGRVDRVDLHSGRTDRWGERVGGEEKRRRSVLQDRRARLWLGQHRGIRVVDLNGGAAQDIRADATVADALPAGPVDQMLEHDGAVWASARGAGLARIDPDTLVPRRFLPGASGLRDADVESMRGAPDGSLWVSHVRGMDRYDSAAGRFTAVAGLPETRIQAFAFAADGSVWLHRFGALERYAPQAGAGYVRTRLIDAALGWPALDAGALVLDARERLWVSTPRGLYRVDPRRDEVRHFAAEAGLQGSEFVDRSLSLRADGVAVAATTVGVVAFDTTAADPQLPSPPLRLTGVRVRRGSGEYAFDPAQPVLLAWNDRDLRVEARALSYVAANRYEFLLQGFDSSWIAGSDSGQRELAQLRTGDYRLHVRAHTGFDDRVELAAPLHVVVAAPPWAQPWAYVLYAALLAAFALLAGFVWRRRVARAHALALASQRRELAEQASAAKSHFLAHLGHEIRTPMTGLLGMAELLQRTPLEPRQLSYVGGIRTSGEHMLRLVNDALDLARVEAGQLRLEQASFDPQRVLHDVADVGHALAARKGIGFLVRLPVRPPVAVVGDAQRLRQILLNIVNNAVKFTEVGGVTLELVAADPGEQRFRISDTGPGMDAAMQARLFQQYSQDANGRSKGGSGLGLAISGELARLMGGHISVETAPGRGSTFTVSLHLPVAPDAPPATPAAAAAAAAPALDVLLVDDDPTVAHVLAELLQSLGHAVRHAPQALAALAEVAIRRPHLVLLDLDLPDVDGFQLARLLRAQEQESVQRLRIVVLTARSDADVEAQARAAGTDGFLRKPVTRALLAAEFGDAAGGDSRAGAG